MFFSSFFSSSVFFSAFFCQLFGAGRNTWDCPPILQNTLVCTWNGITSYNSSTNAQITNTNTISKDLRVEFKDRSTLEQGLTNKEYSRFKLNKDRDMYEEDKDPSQTCRCMFSCLSDLHSHMRLAHRCICRSSCHVFLFFILFLLLSYHLNLIIIHNLQSLFGIFADFYPNN